MLPVDVVALAVLVGVVAGVLLPVAGSLLLAPPAPAGRHSPGSDLTNPPSENIQIGSPVRRS